MDFAAFIQGMMNFILQIVHIIIDMIIYVLQFFIDLLRSLFGSA